MYASFFDLSKLTIIISLRKGGEIIKNKKLIIKNYCEENNIDYKYIRNKLNYYKKTKEKYLPLEIKLQLAISAYNKRKKYTNIEYKGLRLVDYCKSTNIEFKKIANRCKYFIKIHNDFSLLTEEQIEIFINHYYFKQEVNDLRDLFIKLETCNKKEYKEICLKLNINYNQLYKASIKNNTDIKTLIYLCWYSSDKQSSNGIYISQNKLDDLLNYNNLEINDLYGIYKSGKNECLERIFEYEKYYLIGFVLKVVKKYNFKIYKCDYEDLFSEAKILLVKCIKGNVFKEVGRIIKYIEKTITFQILTYLIKNYSYKELMYDDTRKNIKELKLECNY